MKILTEHFTILRYCGLWLPEGWTGSIKNIYHLFMLSMVFMYLSFSASCLMELILSLKNIEDAVNSGVMTFTFLLVCAKIINLIFKRRGIIKVCQYLEMDLCQPKNDKEEMIILESNLRARGILKIFGLIVLGAVGSITCGSIIENMSMRALAFNARLPYYNTGGFGFWITYFHQHIGHAYGGVIGCTADSLFYGTLIHICGQLKILKYRLSNYSDILKIAKKHNNLKINHDQDYEWKFIRDCVNHHLLIIKLSNVTNDIFSFVIFLQFSLTVMILTVTIQTMSKLSILSLKFLYTFLYFSCILGEIFFFCWYGNEVTLESLDIVKAISNGDWQSYTLNTQKCLVIFMARAFTPIVFTSGHVVTLTLVSFNSLLKMSYSAYNLLSQVA
uniref:Odorant receptor n=1 Tax=Aulacocentrum confusum TaxID=2767324 RepID=A0A7G8Z961_9HYME|nr:olfactory receptor 42 [Aulacocentrum confusum]